MKPSRNADYLEFIRSFPCISCGNSETVAHHIRKPGDGIGQKPPDTRTLPLCHTCHIEEHNGKQIITEHEEQLMLDIYIPLYIGTLKAKIGWLTADQGG